MTMKNPYHATMVRRWHANPHLSNTCDPVGYHSGRMGVLALILWPNASRDVLAACLTHDLGEIASGDIPWGCDKTTADDLADEWSRESNLSHHFYLDDFDQKRLKFLDRLDAYLWAHHHALMHVETDDDWTDQYYWILETATELGVYDQCIKLLQ